MKIKMFNISIGTIIWRFYLMLTVVTIGLFTHQTWTIFLGYAIVISCMLGLSFRNKEEERKPVSKVIPMNGSKTFKKVS